MVLFFVTLSQPEQDLDLFFPKLLFFRQFQRPFETLDRFFCFPGLAVKVPGQDECLHQQWGPLGPPPPVEGPDGSSLPHFSTFFAVDTEFPIGCINDADPPGPL